MIRTYEEAVTWIHERLRLGMKPGLARMEWMMEKLGHPERRVRAVHIGGTNGKGSTVAYFAFDFAGGRLFGRYVHLTVR